jgi:hypothetical protein
MMSEALSRYTRRVESYDVEPGGSRSCTVTKIKWVLGYLRRMYGPTSLADFGPPELKAIRTVMIDEGRARKSINKAAVLVRQFFRWCIEEQLVDPTILESLRAVQSLAPGRCGAAEGKPREPTLRVLRSSASDRSVPHAGCVRQAQPMPGIAHRRTRAQAKWEPVRLGNSAWISAHHGGPPVAACESLTKRPLQHCKRTWGLRWTAQGFVCSEFGGSRSTSI